jgi:hypothetical protein
VGSNAVAALKAQIAWCEEMAAQATDPDERARYENWAAGYRHQLEAVVKPLLGGDTKTAERNAGRTLVGTSTITDPVAWKRALSRGRRVRGLRRHRGAHGPRVRAREQRPKSSTSGSSRTPKTSRGDPDLGDEGEPPGLAGGPERNTVRRPELSNAVGQFPGVRP